MKIIKVKDSDVYEGVPDYYSVYIKYLNAFKSTRDSKMMANELHYIFVAEEMGQVKIEEDSFESKNEGG